MLVFGVRVPQGGKQSQVAPPGGQLVEDPMAVFLLVFLSFVRVFRWISTQVVEEEGRDSWVGGGGVISFFVVLLFFFKVPGTAEGGSPSVIS